MDSKITVELDFFQEDRCASPDNKPVIEFFNYLIEHKFINSSKIIGGKKIPNNYWYILLNTK